MEIGYYIAGCQKESYQIQAPKTTYIKPAKEKQTIQGTQMDAVFFRELLALYEAAQTAEEPFIVFQRYNRFFVGIPVEKKRIQEPFLDADSAEKYGLCRLEEYCQKYDILMPYEKSIKSDKKQTVAAYMAGLEEKYGTHRFESFCRNLYAAGLVKQQTVRRQKEKKQVNDLFVFGMKRELFLQFCDGLFAAAARTYAALDRSLDPYERRKDASMFAAFALQCFVAEKTDAAVLRLPAVQFESVRPEHVLMPAFSKNNVALVLSSSDFYVIYLSAMLKSIMENASGRYNYDITILESSITRDNQAILKKMADDYPNISIRFYNVRKKMAGMHLKAGGHISVETYYRLLIPQIFEKYDKILFLDSDMTVHADVAQLFFMDVTGYMVAAAHDPCIAAFCNGSDKTFLPYCIKKLGIEQYEDYFQAGVMLLNLKRFREKYTPDEIFEIAQARQYRYVDQDIMNVLCKGEVMHLPLEWNCFPDMGNYIYEYMPYYLLLEYKQARQNPKICHHTGPVKPWQELFADTFMTDKFWSMSRKTPYVEHVFTRQVHAVVQHYLRDYSVNRPARRVLRFIKNKIVIPIGMIFVKKDTRLYKKIKYMYYGFRGIEIPTWQMAIDEEDAT